jgi:small-conductance mechanosensitive channel
MNRYSINSLITELKHSKSKENYHDATLAPIDNVSFTYLLILLIISLITWVWALNILIKYYTVLPAWAQVTGTLALGMFNMFGAIIAMLIVYSSLQGLQL